MFDGALQVAPLIAVPHATANKMACSVRVCGITQDRPDSHAARSRLQLSAVAQDMKQRGTERACSLSVGERLNSDDLLAAVDTAGPADAVHELELTAAGADHDGCGEVELVVGAAHALAALGRALLWDCHEDTMGSEG